MKYNWKENTTIKYYYREDDGKILGSVWQYVNNNIVWCSKILVDEFPFTNESEKHLGQFINEEFAKKSIEDYWKLEDNTVLEDKIKGVIDAS